MQMDTAASLKNASAIDTLYWVRERLSAGDDMELARMMFEREADVGGRVTAAVRNSIEHQVIQVGSANFHSHLFSFPVLIECEEGMPAELLDLSSVLPLIMGALKESGLAGRKGMLVERIVDHGLLATMGPSQLYALGRDIFILSSATGSLGGTKGAAQRLRALTAIDAGGENDQLAEPTATRGIYCGHLMGCLYSTRGENTRLDHIETGLLMTKLRGIIEFAVADTAVRRVRIGQPQSICTSMATARVMLAKCLGEEMVGALGPEGQGIQLAVDIEIDGLHHQEQSLRVDVADRGLPILGFEMDFAMLEAGAVDPIVTELKRIATDAGYQELKVSYAQSRTRH